MNHTDPRHPTCHRHPGHTNHPAAANRHCHSPHTTPPIQHLRLHLRMSKFAALLGSHLFHLPLRPFVAPCLTPFLILFLTACQGHNASNLLYVHQSGLGVDASLGAQGAAKFSLGYDRETFALVPRIDEPAPIDPLNPHATPARRGEAMSLVSLVAVRADGLSDMHFGHAVATGEVAVDLANDTAALAHLRNAIDQLPNPKPAPTSNTNTTNKPDSSGGAK